MLTRSKLLSFVVALALIAPVSAQTITPQIGGGIGQFDGGISAPGGVPGFVPSGASQFIDAVNNLGYDGTGGTAASKITVARANAGVVFDSAGNASTVGANTARLSYDEENLFTTKPSGLLVEQGVTNGTGAIDFTTAVVGTLGSGGAMPTGMGKGPADNSGLTYDVTAKDATSFTVRAHGTTISGTPVIHFSLGTGAVTPAAVITAGFSAQLTAGSWTNIGTAFASLDVYNSGPALINQHVKALALFSAVNGQYFSTDIVWPFELNNQTVDASAATAGPALFFLPPQTSAVDITLKISRSFVVNAANRLAWQPTASRAADNVTVNKPNCTAPFTKAVQARMQRTVGTGTLWQCDDGTQNNRVTIRATDYGVFLTIVSSGSTLVNTLIADIPKYSLATIALSLSSTAYAVSANGDPAVTGAVTPPSGLTTERIGGDGTNYWNGFIRTVTGYTSAKTSGQVQTLALGGIDFFDDFNRADGAVGTAPTGQSYTTVANTGVGTVVAAIASKFLKATDAGLGGQTSAYTGVQLGATTKLMSAMSTFSTGNSGNGGLLLSDPGGVTTITTTSIHTPYSDITMNWEVYDASVHVQIDGTSGWTAQARDGATRSHCAWIISGNAMILMLASGEVVRKVDSRFSTDGGVWAIYEHLWNNLGDQVAFKSVAAELPH